jgi:hypothetical protein
MEAVAVALLPSGGVVRVCDIEVFPLVEFFEVMTVLEAKNGPCTKAQDRAILHRCRLPRFNTAWDSRS